MKAIISIILFSIFLISSNIYAENKNVAGIEIDIPETWTTKSNESTVFYYPENSVDDEGDTCAMLMTDIVYQYKGERDETIMTECLNEIVDGYVKSHWTEYIIENYELSGFMARKISGNQQFNNKQYYGVTYLFFNPDSGEVGNISYSVEDGYSYMFLDGFINVVESVMPEPVQSAPSINVGSNQDSHPNEQKQEEPQAGDYIVLNKYTRIYTSIKDNYSYKDTLYDLSKGTKIQIQEVLDDHFKIKVYDKIGYIKKTDCTGELRKGTDWGNIHDNNNPIRIDMNECHGSDNDGYFHITGIVHNVGDKNYRFVKLKIELCDENGNVLKTDTCFASGEEGIDPGASQQFESYTKASGISKYRVKVFDYME